jgi:ribosome maturation factor RimP
MTKLERIEEIFEPIAARHGCDIVQLTFRQERPGWVLRALVEKHGADPRTGSGVDHQLCAALSRELGDALDAEDAIAERYVLELSSPGIERPLTRPTDWVRFAGRAVRIETSAPVGGRKRFRGVIGAVEGGGVALALEGGGSEIVPLDAVAKAHLVYEKDGMISKAGVK